MLDLTKEIRPDDRWRKRYHLLQVFIYVVFILGILYLGDKLLFPDKNFSFSFANPTDKNNTIQNVGGSETGNNFDAFSKENFSDARINVVLKKGSAPLQNGEIKIRKTYKAFSYPLDEKNAEFPDGSLLKNSGQFYIISSGKLRKFSTPKIASDLGYQDSNFTDATFDDLSYNEKGSDITDSKNYPDDSLFLIDGNYYQLKNQALYRFVSKKTFNSWFDDKQAITKEKSFLALYPISDQIIGFANGTLISFDIAAFIVVNGKIMPFNNPFTFLSFGFKWSDIIPASEEEIGLYQRDKLFDVSQPHPSGTIFNDIKTGKYYLIENKKKQEIRSNNMLNAYLKKSPVSVNSADLESFVSCSPKKNIWPFRSYSCSTDVKKLESSIGNDFQFEFMHNTNADLSSIEAVFSRKINKENFIASLLNLKEGLLINRGYVNSQ